MTYRNRLHFAAVVRKAIREGKLASYERDQMMSRTAVLADGSIHEYEPAYRPTEQERERHDDDGREYGHPADAKREREDDDDRWLWHRMQAEFSAWGTK